MAYTALYRKWRPALFADVKGQDHIVTTIRNQVASGRLSHAYLFCGTRGTGKTTVAKILAKAVNCENPQDGEPCGCCRSCRSIDDGNSMNVVEIDAASNNGVDNIRELREEVRYAPTEGRYRVYIIDEAHMLTNAAFNAMLKTLEEPPEYVIFIFATTEANRIPITVASRCQHYDFKRIDNSVIAGRLGDMSREEGLTVDEDALRFIAAKGEGSMRDAISLLDRCVAACFDGAITYDRVLDVLGVSDTEACSTVYRALVEGRASDAIALAHERLEKGIDLGNFVSDLIRYLRGIMLLESSDCSEDVLEMSRESIGRMKQDLGMTDLPTVLRFLRILSELTRELRETTQRMIAVEMALVRMARPETEPDTTALMQRISILEKRIAALEAGGVVRAEGMPRSESVQEVPWDEPPVPAPRDGSEQDIPWDEPPVPEPWDESMQEVPWDEPASASQAPQTSYEPVAPEPEPVRKPTFSPAPDEHPRRNVNIADEFSRPIQRKDSRSAAPAAQAAARPQNFIMENWGDIVAAVGGGAVVYFRSAIVEMTDDTHARVLFADAGKLAFGGTERNLELLSEIIFENYNREITFTAGIAEGRPTAPAPTHQESRKVSLDDLTSVFNMDITTE